MPRPQALAEALPARVEAVRNDLERVLTEPLTAAAALASNSLVMDWLAGGEDPAQQPGFVRYLSGVQAQNKALTTFIVPLESGHYFTAKGLDRTLARGPENAWFYDFVDGGKQRSLDIDIDATTGVPTLFINQRIESAGKILGVGGIGLGISAMSDLIRDSRFGIRATWVYCVTRLRSERALPTYRTSPSAEIMR